MKTMTSRVPTLVGGLAAFAATLAVAAAPGTPATAAELTPVIIRLAADHTPPPHPAALAQVFFEKRLPEVIPGSELRVYHAGALYTIPEAVEALTDGNLEMAWGQFGKTASVDRWMNVVAGPMLLTTPGAMEQLDSFESVKALREKFANDHEIKMFAP